MARTAESIFAGDGGAFPFAEGSAAPPDLAETLSSKRGEKSGTLSFGNESGFGEMRLVEVLPGVSVSFNDFGMDGYLSTFSTASDVLCVDWCRDGRIEQPMPDGSYAYVSAGDLKVDDRTRHSGSFAFPTSRYRGITTSFDLSCAPASIRRALPGFSVDLRELKRRFCRDGRRVFPACPFHGIPVLRFFFVRLLACFPVFLLESRSLGGRRYLVPFVKRIISTLVILCSHLA